jgi:hypothetical protein
MGNGYRRIWKDQTESEKITIQCMKCESAGEIDEEPSYDYSGVKTFDPNDLLDPTSTIVKQILSGGKK